MARWMKGPTSAETSTPDHLETHAEPLWLAKRQKQRGSELKRWLLGLTICGVTAYALQPPSKATMSESVQPDRSANDQRLTQSKGISEGASSDGSGEAGEEQSGVEEGLNSAESATSVDQPSLLWWTDASVAPTGEALISCLARPGQAPIELRPHPQGYYVFTPGRPQPQSLYARRGQLWLETPLLGSPHQQAYDHLALATCVKTPDATLYDPQLIRQWSGASWPKRDPQSGSFALDDLFLIRSEGSAHHTHGLKRLGLPELGLISSATGARDVLRWVSLAWISAPQSRESLKTVAPPPIKLGGWAVSTRPSREVVEWLGSIEVSLLTDAEGRPLNERTVKALSRALKSVGSSKARSRRGSKSKGRRVKRDRGETKVKNTGKRKSRGKSRGKRKSKSRDRGERPAKSPRRELLRYQ